jgi:DNA polymerase-3 subunit epsilon
MAARKDEHKSMNFLKPIIFFDIEATGTDVAKDRIVSLCMKRFSSIGAPPVYFFYDTFNPGVEMTDEVVAIHGITNEEVKRSQPFENSAKAVLDSLNGCDLGGFNLYNFDIPILWEELNRCGLQWDLTGVSVIDVGNIFKKKEERTLSAAVKFYCAKELENAHSADADVDATVDVLSAQLLCYDDLQKMSVAELAAFSRFDDRLDLAGKLIRDKDGEAVYNLGNKRGTRVKDDPSFAYWMLGRDFPSQTKQILQSILDQLANREPEEVFP